MKIHLLRNETWTFCGKRWQPGAFTHYFKEPTCKTCLRSAHYNFVMVHSTLRVTPAMEAGVTDRLWSIGDVLEWANW